MGGCDIDEESHQNCVCASQRYRATDLPERWRAQGNFVCGKETQLEHSMYRCVGGGGGRGLTREVEQLIYVLRRRDPAMS